MWFVSTKSSKSNIILPPLDNCMMRSLIVMHFSEDDLPSYDNGDIWGPQSFQPLLTSLALEV